MPMFKYRCRDCGHVYDELLKTSQEECPCPKCGGTGLRHYQGKCYFGKTGGSDGSSGGHSCSGGHCSTCSGCG